jgi:hypothetical protein
LVLKIEITAGDMFDIDDYTMVEAVVDYAVRNCKMLSHLVIKTARNPYNCSQYRDVVGLVNFSFTLFNTLENNGHNIRELEMEWGFIASGHVLEMRRVLGQLTSLTLLTTDDLKQNSLPDPNATQMLGNLCSNLCHLDLFDNPLSKNDLQVLLIGLKDSLISLKLNCPYDKIQDEPSPFIHCTLLEKLWLTGCCHTAKDIKTIGRLGSLKWLKIEMDRGQDNLKDDDYKQAFEQRQLISLQQLELSGDLNFKAKAAMALLKYCPSLINWSVSSLSSISSISSLYYVHGACDGLADTVADCGPEAITLQKLEISGLDRNAIMAVSTLCNLRELHISHTHLLSELDYWEAFQQGNLVNLKVVTLTNCNNLDSEGFKALLKGSLKLQHVKLNFLHKITGYSVIFEECILEHLENFHVVNCPGFYDWDVEVLKRNCPKIINIVHERVGKIDFPYDD